MAQECMYAHWPSCPVEDCKCHAVQGQIRFKRHETYFEMSVKKYRFQLYKRFTVAVLRFTADCLALARRYYHHVLNGGTMTADDLSRMVQAMERKDALIEDLEILIMDVVADLRDDTDKVLIEKRIENAMSRLDHLLMDKVKGRENEHG